MERPQRTIYFNDARHFFLFVFEPPMTIEDAWRPVDEVAGTGVNTLVYGIARADGLFFPTKTGKLFCSHLDDIENSIYWKVRENILSLQERGLDLLQVLADRAHEKRMEFFTSFRMGTYEGVGSPSSDPNVGGRGLAIQMHVRNNTGCSKKSRPTTSRALNSTLVVALGVCHLCSWRMTYPHIVQC